jgi:hypothetical protein
MRVSKETGRIDEAGRYFCLCWLERGWYTGGGQGERGTAPTLRRAGRNSPHHWCDTGVGAWFQSRIWRVVDLNTA